MLNDAGDRPSRRWKLVLAAAAGLGAIVFLSMGCAGPQVSRKPSPPPRAPAGVTVTSVRADGLDADFFRGSAPGPQRAVILLGGSEGGKGWSEASDFVQELVGEGFCVLSLGYFGTGDLPPDLRAIPLEYFAKAFRWLAAQKGQVVPDEYVLIGVSRGAELALLLASDYPEVKAVVAIAPSSVVFPGPPTGTLDALRRQHSAWSRRGRELAFVPIPVSWTTVRGMLTGKRTRMFEQALRNAEAATAAAIPVENIRGPVLLTSFTADQIWPSTLMSGQMAQRLREHRFGYYYEHAAYNGRHSQWSLKPCHEKILSFLREHGLPSSAGTVPEKSNDAAPTERQAPVARQGRLN